MKLYRLLLSFYPARFREEYGGPLEQQFADEYRDAQSSTERARLWLRALLDLSRSIPVELAAEMRQDLAHSLRVHARRPFLMLFTVAILALAIGGATGVFSVVNAVLIKALPFRDPSRLVILSEFFEQPIENPAQFHKWRTSSAYLEDAARVLTAEVTVSGLGVPLRVTVSQTSFNFFSVLGVDLPLGRAFAPSEDLPGNDAVAVISYSLWQQLFAGDPNVLGRSITLNGVSQTIVGVAPRGLDYPQKSAVWTPTAFDLNRLPDKGAAWAPFGRLKRGLSLQAAEPMFEAEAKLSAPELSWSAGGSTPSPRLVPLKDDLSDNIREAALTLMAATGFILLIACANVANLQLTRATERTGELTIRAALGASRARLAQQLLTEGVALSALAAAGGLAVAYGAAKLATLTEPAALASQEYTILDWRVLGFAVCLAAVTGLLFGVAPAWLARQLPSAGVARANQTGRHTNRLRTLLIALQVALTVVLLAGSMTMGRGLEKLLGTDLGFRTEHMVGVNVSLAGTNLKSPAERADYYARALARLRAMQGTESAAAAFTLPLDNMFGIGTVRTDAGEETKTLLENRVTPDYFRTMKSPLLFGREFTARDGKNVAVISEGLARYFGGGAAAIGRTFTPRFNDSVQQPVTVVGVVQPARYAGPTGPMLDQYYLPLDRDAPKYATFVIRVRGDARNALAVCRDAVQSVDPQVAVFNVNTLEQRFNGILSAPRFRTTVFLFFGAFALLLAIAGIYGMSSYSVALRRREIGVRIAIGASAQRVRGMMLRQALPPIVLGTAAGIGGAFWESRLISHLLEAAPPVDLRTCAAAALLLALVAIAATWIATSRVLDLKPADVLKSD